MLSLITIPWTLKFIWSPLVDRYSFNSKEHYRPWILVCQSLLALTLVLCAFLDIEQNIAAIVFSLFLVSFLAATQDIATDALAISLLSPEERGLGNGVQSAGNYLGAILGGGGMLLLLNRLGWQASLLTLAVLVLLASIPIWLHQEQVKTPSFAKKPDFMGLINFCRRRGMGQWLLTTISYTMGARMAFTMFRPLLVDLGFSLSDIGLLIGIIGSSSAMVASPIAGILITPLGRKRSLIIFGIFLALAIALFLIPAVGISSFALICLICIVVQMAIGMTHTAQFTVMMDKSQLNTAGTDYTLQVSIKAFGSLIASSLSGVIAEAIGYIPFDTGLVALGDEIADIPRDRVINEPDDFIEKESLNVGYNLEHRFSDNWTLRNAFRYDKNDDHLETAINFPFIGTLDESTGDLDRSFAIQDVGVENYSLQTNAIGKFNTGAIEHKLLLGIDLARNQTEQTSRNDFSEVIPINIFAPVYGAFPRPGEDDLPVSQSTDIRVDSLGIYLQDQVSLTDSLIASAGIRYDTIEQETASNTTDTETTQNDDAFSPNLGIVYKPLQNLSLYASYSQSFTPNAEVAEGDVALEPETGEGYEIGAKAEFLSGKLLATLAYFDITKNNVATADPDNPLFSVATGEQNSNGIELDIIGKILPGLNITASYSYIDAEVTEDNTIPVGNKLPGVPEHSASLWTNYEIQRGDLQGLGFGMGFNFIGSRQGDLDNSFELDSYFLTNAGIYYQRDNWRTALNFKNIFDINYITGTPINRTRGIQAGEPFTVIGSVSLKFN
ncbi:membrane hypothetical protein [Hyella patelloides LEGE 07179]|uniref:Major facilitator superfamily (MFS) profile domain-containing protein n=1 Tax=Hyella patelloides LEGE 07179 TaxID=945734 RepID=A0A563W0V9_9CYAN|nr:TonB-dependent siderophore receptor [Hyella patelloides]VEP17334.1 membrane hypothetical protein [Hyella patelloides LEGE 07179]